MVTALGLCLRRLVRWPGGSAVVVLTLALGIGANSALFSVVDAVLLAPLPYPQGERLVRIEGARDAQPGRLSLTEVRELGELPVFEAIAAYQPAVYNLSGDGPPEVVPTALATSTVFEVLGTPLLHGASFPPELDRARGFGVILSHALWQRRFGGDPAVVGRTMTLDAAPGYEIHGVLPAGFEFVFEADLFRSAVYDPAQVDDRSVREVYALARLRRGATLAEARAEVAALAERLARDHVATNRGLGLRLTPLRELWAGDVRPHLLLLTAAVTLVLLIVCANVASLLLARVAAREREMALCAALGAGRARLLWQGLAESLVLAVLGGGSGLLLGSWGIAVLRRSLAPELPPWMTIALDLRVVAFTFLIALAAGLVSGFVPALRAARVDLASVLRAGARGSSTAHQRLRRVLVVAEIAFAVVLLVGAALVLESFSRLAASDPGFETEGLLTFRIDLPWRKYPTNGEETVVFFETFLRRLESLPGVESAAIGNNLPMAGSKTRPEAEIRLVGQNDDAASRNPFVNEHRVSAGYFETMGIALERGRFLDTGDRRETRPVAVVSSALADRLWRGEDPLGKELRLVGLDGLSEWLAVVGVAADVRHDDPAGAPGLDVYVAFAQDPTAYQYGVVRASVPPRTLVEEIARAAQEVDPDQAIFETRTMAERIAARTWQRRIARALFGFFALLAAVLAAVGIYGVMTDAIRRRTREIGIRMALGGTPADALRRALAEASTLAAIGAAVGLGAALLATRWVRSLLYGVSPHDPWVYLGVLALVMVTALVAGLVPAWRAARVVPVEALRVE